MSNSLLELRDVWVSYPDKEIKKRNLLSIFRARSKKFWALKGLNFDVKQGEVLGVIGRNGSGKSTLLKLLSGLIAQDKGEFILRGQRPILLTLGAGFQPELLGIQNIYLNGLLLGYNRAEIEAKLDEIIEFSELGEFIYKPVRTYSSGMKSRLGFATAITLEPQILLLDEILGVGDVAFRAKCEAKIKEKIKGNQTVIIVTHSDSMLRSMCNRAVWIHAGEQMAFGDATSVAAEYSAFMKRRS